MTRPAIAGRASEQCANTGARVMIEIEGARHRRMAHDRTVRISVPKSRAWAGAKSRNPEARMKSVQALILTVGRVTV